MPKFLAAFTFVIGTTSCKFALEIVSIHDNQYLIILLSCPVLKHCVIYLCFMNVRAVTVYFFIVEM
jgi:hypothetical protein